jgi:hypothetical protein
MMQLFSPPGENNGLGHGPHHALLSAAMVINRLVISLRPPWLIFSAGRFIFDHYLINVSLNLGGMSPLKGSQEDHWKGKISWKCYFQAKPDIILAENCLGGLPRRY